MKKLISFLLIQVFLLSLCSCQNQPPQSTPIVLTPGESAPGDETEKYDHLSYEFSYWVKDLDVFFADWKEARKNPTYGPNDYLTALGDYIIFPTLELEGYCFFMVEVLPLGYSFYYVPLSEASHRNLPLTYIQIHIPKKESFSEVVEKSSIPDNEDVSDGIIFDWHRWEWKFICRDTVISIGGRNNRD